jgi:transposase
MVRSIKLVLFDRSFYSKELIMALTDADYPHLIFVPKNKRVAAELAGMAEGERKTVHYEFELNRDRTVLRGETTLAFLRKVMDPSNGKTFGWAFATNQEQINLDYIVATYKGRWRIETGFRV